MGIQEQNNERKERRWSYNRYEYRLVRYGMRDEKFIVPWQMDHSLGKEIKDE